MSGIMCDKHGIFAGRLPGNALACLGRVFGWGTPTTSSRRAFDPSS